jgi:hypothetical protein
MKKQLAAVVIFVGLVLLNLPARASEYYVATNGNDSWNGLAPSYQSGTIGPWKTIGKANGVLQAGDTVFIRAGTYAGEIIQPGRSGVSDSQRIVYSSYNGEDVLIRDSAYGIYLYKKSYVSVNAIRFFSLRRFMRIYAGHYNIISYCDFDTRSPASGDWVGALIADDYNDNTSASENSTYNWVHHCSFFRWVYGTYAEHRGGILDIGSWEQNPVDESCYNLIEYNTFAYGGHHTMGVYSKYNVVRNNYFHNETNPDNWAFEGYRDAITEGPVGGYCLYESNRFGFSGASGLSLRTPYNLLRFNLFYGTASGGLQVVSSAAGQDHADYNRIYRNSFYHNGHQEIDPGFQGGMYFANWSAQSPLGNIVKSNIFYNNKNGSISYEGQVNPQVIENNWDQNSVDPGFVDLSGTNPDNPDLPDLHLKANSAAIDGGTFLTTITSASGSGTQFQVLDARYFMDGWGIPHVQGDEIQIFGSTQRARISSVNYTTNTITVDKVLTWTQNQGLCLVYQSSAPDLGAYEYVPFAVQAILLSPGWNWISFNVMPSILSLNSVFTGVLSQVEQVKTQTQSAIRSSGNWKGGLADMAGIGQYKMHKVKVSSACTLTVTGTAISPTTPIQLGAGWNWVAYLPATTVPIATALDSIKVQVLQIKSLTQSATYSGGSWNGTLIQLVPSQGYAIKMSAPGILTYPGGQ